MIIKKKRSLSSKQIEFTKKIGLLINYATSIGYGLTFSDAYAIKGHKKNSFHYKRLAVDFNLFIDGKYMVETNRYLQLGLFWEGIGGSWGGRWDDGCHFSLGE